MPVSGRSQPSTSCCLRVSVFGRWILGFVWLLGFGAWSFGADAASDWPTVAHDMQRTGYAPVGPTPPFKVRWMWVDGKKWTGGYGAAHLPNWPNTISVRFNALMQPMIRGDLAYIASIDGQVFAIDLKTGETRWKARVQGEVLHCVTVGPSAVYVATTRGLEAVSLEGKNLWRFESPRVEGFWCCPALAQGLVLAGSLGGTFHAIDEKTGRAKWSFVADAPIYHSPAVHENLVFFGAEDMHLYALKIADGTLAWKSERLPGISFGHYWPVVAAKAGKLLVRTCPPFGTAGSEVMAGAPFDYDKAQGVLREHFAKNPEARSFFMLDLADGKESVKVHTGHFGMQGDLSPAAIVRDDGTAFAWHYSKEGSFQVPKGWGRYSVPVDFGPIDFATGEIRSLGPPGTTSPPSITRDDDFHHNVMGGNYLYGLQDTLFLGAVPLDGKGGRFKWEMDAGLYIQHFGWADYRADTKTGMTGSGRCDAGGVCGAVGQDVFLSNPMCGLYIAAFESQGGQR